VICYLTYLNSILDNETLWPYKIIYMKNQQFPLILKHLMHLGGFDDCLNSKYIKDKYLIGFNNVNHLLKIDVFSKFYNSRK
jgi:hypothetical protein